MISSAFQGEKTILSTKEKAKLSNTRWAYTGVQAQQDYGLDQDDSGEDRKIRMDLRDIWK